MERMNKTVRMAAILLASAGLVASDTALSVSFGAELSEAVPFLLDKARSASEAGEAYTCEVALRAACVGRHKYSSDTRRQIADALVENADHTAYNVREVVAWGLGVVGDEAHIPLLERIAAQDQYSKLATKVINGESVEVEVYPVREEAAKSIENIRRRLAGEQKAAAQ